MGITIPLVSTRACSIYYSLYTLFFLAHSTLSAPGRANTGLSSYGVTPNDIVCPLNGLPITGWPQGTDWSASSFQDLKDACYAYGNKKGNVGCLCPQPGQSFDIECYKDLADPDLFGEHSIYYMCLMSCHCALRVMGNMLDWVRRYQAWGLGNYPGSGGGGGGSRPTNRQGLGIGGRPTIPLSASTYGSCQPGNRNCELSKYQDRPRSKLALGSIWKARQFEYQAGSYCSARPCASFSDCAGSSASTTGVARSHCRCAVGTAGAQIGTPSIYRTGACRDISHLIKRGGVELRTENRDTVVCACNASFVSESCCFAGDGIVFDAHLRRGQIDLGLH